MKKIYLFFGAATLFSLTFFLYLDHHLPQKNSAVTYERAPASASLFEKDVDRVYAEIKDVKIFNRDTCEDYLTDITDFLLTKGAQTYLPATEQENNLLLGRAEQIVQKIFYIRLLLKERFDEFNETGEVNKGCVNKVRAAFRYARFLEEFITEMYVTKNKQDKSTHVFDPRDLSQGKMQLMLNPKFAKVEFKTGDILMVRAMSFVSATIARVGDEDGQFSHAAMIYVDNGTPYVIESLIESGVGITPLKEWRAGHHARTVLYRMKDRELAVRAATKLYEVVKKRLAEGNPVPYDFKMKTDQHDEIFCAEIVQWALDMVTDGHSPIPHYMTEFNEFRNHNFLYQLTIDEVKTFSPNDLEVEPAVEVVAEWRNYEATRLRRVQDVVLVSILDWMVKKGYVLKSTARSMSMSHIAWIGRKLFGFKKDQIPPNMPYGFLKTFIKLEKVSNVLETYLSDLEEEYFVKTGHSMDYKTMREAMEKLRIEDCKTYIRREREWQENVHRGNFEPPRTHKSLFHNMFNTPKRLNCL